MDEACVQGHMKMRNSGAYEKEDGAADGNV